MPESVLRFLRPAVLLGSLVAAFGAWSARLEYLSSSHITKAEVLLIQSHLLAEDRAQATELAQLNAKLDVLIRFACRQSPDSMGCP